MSQAYTLQFLHRLNDDGTMDSICRECFTTVATTISESALKGEEQRHACDPALLDRYKKVRPYKNFPVTPRLA
jgi:hypothetical protein